MTDQAIPPPAHEGARAMLTRGGGRLHSRVLPPLTGVQDAVDRILSRWPDMMRKPDERDREKLAKDMLFRVQNNRWERITTQRVVSAAVALFDEERLTRVEFDPARQFYLEEIAASNPGPFLDGMVGVYIDSFEQDAPHTRLLAKALGGRNPAVFGGRLTKLCEALPALFRPDAAPSDLARVMLAAEDPYTALKSMGFGMPHASGLARCAHRAFVKRIGPDLAQTRARTRLFNWLTPESGPVLQVGAARAVEALVSVWREQDPPDALRNELSEQIIAAWNDPRLNTGGIWATFDPSLRAILLRWLTHQDMKFFCDMVTATQNSHMWAPRRDFWLQLYEDKMISEAWVAFGAEARRYAEQNLVRTGKTDMSRRFGRQHDRGGKTSLLVMRIGNKIVVDGCQNYKTHIFRADDEKAPKLYERNYFCDAIMNASRHSKSHRSIKIWSQWVLQNV